MINEIAAVGTLFGLSLEIYDRIAKQKPSPDSMMLTSLLNVSKVASGWKAFHTNYHALYRDVQAVVETTTSFRDGQREPKAPQDILTNGLRRTIFQGNLPNAVLSFRNTGRRQVRNIDKLRGPGTPEFERARDILAGCAFEDILENVSEICKLKEETTAIHVEFISFLKGLDDLIAKPKWGEPEVCFVIDHYRLLSSKYAHVISCTDLALMNILEIYEVVIDHYEGEEI